MNSNSLCVHPHLWQKAEKVWVPSLDKYFDTKFSLDDFINRLPNSTILFGGDRIIPGGRIVTEGSMIILLEGGRIIICGRITKEGHEI